MVAMPAKTSDKTDLADEDLLGARQRALGIAQPVVAVDHVVGGQLRAVVEGRVAQLVGVGLAIRRLLD